MKRWRDEPHPENEDCIYCQGCYWDEPYPMREKDCCQKCYEDGGPHAGDDPFGRTDEDWKRHAE